jgi:hypothetical protein
VHFTYVARPSGSDLQQGDILRRTGDLKAQLDEIHRYYGSHAEYEHLMVLTQSCDLVRRDGAKCKSPYISVAAVRPLQTLLERRLDTMRRSDTERAGAFASETTHKLMLQFTERLLNNNEAGYFFLREDPGFGIGDEARVAFLTLSIALKSEQHYQRCLDVRIGGLREEFQAKLGWLVGNIYARPATRDWVPDECTSEDFETIQEGYLKRLGIIWVADRDMDRVKRVCKTIAAERKVDVDQDIAVKAAAQVAAEKESKHRKLAARAAALLRETGLLQDDTQRELYERRLASDAGFRALV